MADLGVQQQQQQAVAPMMIPPGFGFHPTDQEMVGYYLTRAVVHGEPLFIGTLDLYAREPWELPALATVGGPRAWYFFVPVHRSPRGLANRRTAGGFWKSSGYKQPIRTSGDDATVVGTKRTHIFYVGSCRQAMITPWRMVEYELRPAAGAAPPPVPPPEYF